VVRDFKVLPYAIQQGSIGAYYPETSPLLPLAHHDLKQNSGGQIDPGFGQAAATRELANAIQNLPPGAFVPETTGVVNYDIET
jgi:hypothetical protein